MSAFIWTGSLECPLMRGISWLEHVKVENCCMWKKRQKMYLLKMDYHFIQPTELTEWLCLSTLAHFLLCRTSLTKYIIKPCIKTDIHWNIEYFLNTTTQEIYYRRSELFCHSELFSKNSSRLMSRSNVVSVLIFISDWSKIENIV